MFELSGEGLTADAVSGIDIPEKVDLEGWATTMPKASHRSQPLTFDLETTPDTSRQHLFGLPEIPEPTEVAEADCLPDVDILSGTVGDVGERLAGRMFPPQYLAGLTQCEQSQKKPRKGVLELITQAEQARENYEAAVAGQQKTMSVTPEFCRIVALGFAIGDGEPRAAVLGRGCMKTEEQILEYFWQLVAKHSPLVGFNVLGFDLPVIFVRSAILGVQPTKLLDLRPWGKDVVDLMALRFAKSKAMKLKDLARVLGIEVPAGDCDGSQVGELLAGGKLDELANYVASDVAVTRELYRFYRGFWCV